MTWSHNDIPQQRDENIGHPVTYRANEHGHVSEVRRDPVTHEHIFTDPLSKTVVSVTAGTTQTYKYQDLQHSVLTADGVSPVSVSAIGQQLGTLSTVKSVNAERRYLPTLAELVDRLTIVQLKSIFIPEHSAEYKIEIDDILHDIDLILDEKGADGFKLNASAIRSIVMIMLTNRYIWENEGKARAGGSDQDRLLKLTHSINGVRNTAKNALAVIARDRVDLKVDCFAADLTAEFGNWDVF